jgi:hypothetical protein
VTVHTNTVRLISIKQKRQKLDQNSTGEDVGRHVSPGDPGTGPTPLWD